MKKILILSVLAIATTIGWAQEFDATEPTNVGGINYVLYEDGLAVTYNRTWKQINDAGGAYYTNYTGDIVIPETVEGYKVVAILKESFTGREGCSITSISIPSTVRSIGDHAFYDCHNLETVELPASLESIGDGAFILCAVKSMTIPVSCMSIGGSAFNDSGIETFTIEDSDQPLTIGGSGYTIGSVLSFMPKCKTMYVGRQINYEGDYGTFWGCDNITDVTYGPNVTSIKVHEWWRSPSIQHVTFLTDQVTEIPEAAFSECTALESVQLPNYVQVIADNAFNGCPISYINIPETVTFIGNSAFNGCALTSMTIPAACTNIGGSAFNNSAIEIFTLADGAELLNIGGSGSNVGSCLSSMPNCKTMYVGRQIVYDGRVFWGCENITDVTYGPNVTSLGQGEWWRSPSIQHVTFLTDQVTEIPENAFSECTALESVQLPAQVQVIADNAFNGCPISYINIPETVTSIGNSAFKGCALTSMTIPAACTNIGGSAFNNSAIETFTLADGAELLNIGGSGSTVGSCLSSMANCKTMYVGRQIVYDGRVFWGCENITDVTYGPNVTSLGNGEWWRSPSIKHVTFLSPQLTVIAEDAFSECTALETVSLPENLVNIEKNAFASCKALTELNLPSTVVTIGQSAFNGCVMLTSLVIPASVESIDDNAFNGCDAVETLRFEDSDNTINLPTYNYGNILGGWMHSLKSIYLGRNYYMETKSWVTTLVGQSSSLEELIIGDNVNEIWQEYMCYSCKNLKRLVIGKGVTSIAKEAFDGCTSLESIEVLAEVPPVCGENVFYNVDTEKCLLSVPSESLAAYKAADVWKEFFSDDSFVDFNEDGDMNVTDVVTLISCIAKNDFTSVSKEAADVNGDGEVNVTDVVTLILMIATSK